MEVKLLTESDAEQYWSLRLEALKNSPEAFGSSYEEAILRENPIETVKRSINNEDNYTFGAFDGETLVGMTTLLREPALKLRHRANIYAVYVSDRFRGTGTGKALMIAAIEQARSLDSLKKLNLSVVTTNETAKKLYEKLGFVTFGLEEKALNIGEDYYDEEHMVLFYNK